MTLLKNKNTQSQANFPSSYKKERIEEEEFIKVNNNYIKKPSPSAISDTKV